MLLTNTPTILAGAAAESAGAETMIAHSSATAANTLVVPPMGAGPEAFALSTALGANAGVTHGILGEIAASRIARAVSMATGGLIIEEQDLVNTVNGSLG
ncbi:Uncharacterised protein [Mycobacteroides abscessus subsp. abscessus]|uniref:hypothetical protein n=2 Tax=Mycobacteroides abscessus TaxID=36809 RepID=UPI0009293801|nr:hypothetical protein [Mycobacteroides abscessus]MBE5453011.1 hypothetical protein [Mycobacteroides abscessus]SHQ54242.1 Uncharacterised protein [Mycobacteroides abscessus subsp. abscessus]SHR82938.1 Uncharacterised protein [Mycobacteroides abscessus subsp. abscessus]SIC06609.1 Uncharacterised protein [Mycobacteroides abscessus subsp. abscessus]SLL30876.1 Uncharacterised protein [Mycobacteroides abscessus subsp. abscessus]